MITLTMTKNKSFEFQMASTTHSSSMIVATSLDFTEIDQSLNLWSEIFPMIEKDIEILSTIAQEIQECPERAKYVDALMKIASRINHLEDKATTCIKEARSQLKKSQVVEKENNSQKGIFHSTLLRPRDDDDDDNEQMEVDESHINEQIEIPALDLNTLEKLQDQFHQILSAQRSNSESVNLESDHRYADFADSIGKMSGNDEDDDANVVNQVVSTRCPLTQKAFVEPVQNKKCKHKYEKQTVLKYIADKQKARRPAKCPSAGCENILNEKDLISA